MVDGPGAPHASLPRSCALGRQRVQRRRLHWYCFQQQEQQQQRIHHQQRLPAAHAEQPREPDAQQTARLHLQASAQLLHDSVQLRCPRHATSHRSIYRRGGTRRWLLTSSSCLLGHVVYLGKSCASPQRFCVFVHGQQPKRPASADGAQLCGSC